MIYRDPAYSEKAINNFAFKVSRRLYAAGDRSLSVSDIRQELWVAWVLAVESFDETQGTPFLAYLRNGMRMHINRFVDKNVGRRHEEVIAYSLDRQDSDSQDHSLHEQIPSTDPDLGEDIENRSSVDALCRKLSPVARQFVKLLYEQPEPLMGEVLAMMKKSEFASSMDIMFINSGRLTKAMIFDLLGVPQRFRTSIIREIEEATSKLAKA